MKPHIIKHRGLCLVCIPKVANTSMKAAILEDIGRTQGKRIHRDPALPLYTIEEVCLADKPRAFIRNPMLRLVSAWRNKLATDGEGVARKNMQALGYRTTMTFDQFADHCQWVRDEDLHTRQQIDFLPDGSEVRRYEWIADGWKVLQGEFAWLADLPHLNTTEKTLPTMSDATIELVRTLYADDYALWECI